MSLYGYTDVSIARVFSDEAGWLSGPAGQAALGQAGSGCSLLVMVLATNELLGLSLGGPH